MILAPRPLQHPSFNGAGIRAMRPAASSQARTAVLPRPVLQTLRAPLQLCLDLQPRLRQE